MIQVRLFGSLQVSAPDGRPLEPLVRRPRRCALLAWLAANAGSGLQRRDTVLALFWPELDEPHARAALSQSLYVLREALGEDAIVTRGRHDLGVIAGWEYGPTPRVPLVVEVGLIEPARRGDLDCLHPAREGVLGF